MNRMRKSLAVTLMAVALATVLTGCVFSPKKDKPVAPDPLSDNTTPANAIKRFLGSYEQKKAPEYQGMFTGDFTYEFSNSTDPTLVNLYSTGWFKTDEKESSSHLFNGYTPPGGQTLPAATTIDINLAVMIPTDDNSSGVDPASHKILATRVDGGITVPQAGQEPLTYVITNNYNVFYLVRGDAAVDLDTTQPADASHWYIYRWVDLSEATPAPAGGLRTASTAQPQLSPMTWAHVRADWH
jgi:hypothetical protein